MYLYHLPYDETAVFFLKVLGQDGQSNDYGSHVPYIDRYTEEWNYN